VGVVPDAAPALTKISFRRDVRIFLTALGFFFAVLVAVLLILLHATAGEARAARTQTWTAITDAAARDIGEAVAAGQTSNVGIILTALRARHPIAGAEAVLQGNVRFTSGALADNGPAVVRRGSWGTLRIIFDDTSMLALSRHIDWTTGITIAATVAGLLLLLLYIPRIVRPIEALLDQASELEERPPSVDEQAYLIDTFRKTVSTLKQQQEELRALHDEQKSRADELDRVTRALTRGMTSGVLAIDPHGRLADINQAGREILRLPPQDAPGDGSIESVLGPTAFGAFVREALDARAPLTRRETTVRVDDTTLIIGVTTVPLRDDSGAFFGMLVLFTDLTGIRALETRLRESQILADLGEMAAGIAHEFRNSLSTILGYVKLAQRAGAAEAILDKVRKAEEEAVQLSAAVESLLAFARPVALQLQPVDMHALVRDEVSRLEPSAPGVRFAIDGELTLDGDPALLARALQNVLRNAVESIQARGGVEGRVDVALDAARRRIEIRDNGIGLEPKDASRFLLPFHSGKSNGFGLGLPLAKKIAVLHGGTVSLHGAPGHGATVTIELGKPVPDAARTVTLRTS
jgi:signal transduction histidine kinase